MAGVTETKAQLRAREVTARDALKNTLDMAVGTVETLAEGTPKVDGPRADVGATPDDDTTWTYFNRGLLFRVGGRWYKASIRAYDPTADAGDKGD
jgi:hypothetical protein